MSWLSCFGLEPRHLNRKLPVCVASTGLPYLVIPVNSEGLATARIVSDQLERRLATVGARFAYLFDVEEYEGRTMNVILSGSVVTVALGEFDTDVLSQAFEA